jgi:hypothetical protein
MFKLKLDEGKELVIKNTTLKGKRSITILSSIKDYTNTCKPDFSKPDSKPKVNEARAIQVCKKYNIDLSNNKTEEGQKAINDYFEKNPHIALELYVTDGNSEILFEIITEVLEYYQNREGLDNTISEEDFCVEDILQVIKHISENPKNQLQDFLKLISTRELPKLI